jgi:hypothetical protein
MGKAPSFQYYPKDWRADSVFTCSLAARGLWREMMDMMHAQERYGYLSMNGLPIPNEAIARYCGCSLQEYQTLLTELFAANVPRRTHNGVIYSKRMVEDERKRKEWRNRQKKHRDTTRDVTSMSRLSHADLHSSSANLTTTPLPPAPAGEHIERFIRYGETIAVDVGRKKRLLSKDEWHSLDGARADSIVSTLKRKGFNAWIEQTVPA